MNNKNVCKFAHQITHKSEAESQSAAAKKTLHNAITSFRGALIWQDEAVVD